MRFDVHFNSGNSIIFDSPTDMTGVAAGATWDGSIIFFDNEHQKYVLSPETTHIFTATVSYYTQKIQQASQIVSIPTSAGD